MSAPAADGSGPLWLAPLVARLTEALTAEDGAPVTWHGRHPVTGAPLSVELGPGLIENIYDGIQRPLEEIVRRVGSNITRGIQVPPLDRDRLWDFTPTAAVDDTVAVGDILGTVPETESVLHKIMVPKGA